MGASAFVCIRALSSASVRICLRPCVFVRVRAYSSASVRARSFVGFFVLNVQTRPDTLSALSLDASLVQGPSRCTIGF